MVTCRQVWWGRAGIYGHGHGHRHGRHLLAGLGALSVVITPGLHARPSDAGSDVCQRNESALAGRLDRLWQHGSGRIGVAVRRADCGWVLGERIGEFMPQQSVSKLWVALAVFDAVDRGEISLGQRVTLTRDDLTLFNQPLRAMVLRQGEVSLTVQQLLEHALIHSDNSANNRLLRLVGGPAAVRAMLARKHLLHIRFGPGERALQSQIAGLSWRPEYSYGTNFYAARNRVPMARRRAALAHYLANPADGATPAGIVSALVRLAQGDVLSAPSTAHMMAILAETHSGPHRLKGGLQPGWKIWHKTGTGQILETVATGYNDVALLKAPDGAVYAVAVMMAETREPITARMALMRAIARELSDRADIRAHG